MMKKTTVLRALALLLLLPLLLPLGACSRLIYEPYTAMRVYTRVHDHPNFPYADEYEPWSEEKQTLQKKEGVPAEQTITFRGKSYTGTYQGTAVIPPNQYETHTYGWSVLQFQLHAETGELVAFALYFGIYDPSDKSTLSLNEEQCRTVADAFAKGQIDLKAYRVKASSDDHFFTFLYYREKDGFITADQLTVRVDRHTSEIAGFERRGQDAFQRAKFAYDETKAIAALEAKIEAAFPSKHYAKTSYEITERTLIRLEDNSYGILYTVDVTALSPLDAGGFVDDGGELLIVITLPRK